MPLVDLLGDTITHPTEAMREAMRGAPRRGGSAGVIPRLVPGERGVITAARLESALANSRQVPGLLCLENTHNLAGGTVTTPQQTTEVCAVAHGRGMRVHIDGARG